MSRPAQSASQFFPGEEFKGSLARTIVVVLIALSIFPAVIIGLATEIRSRQVLRNQAELQINSIVRSQQDQLENLGTQMSKRLLDFSTTNSSYKSEINYYLENLEDEQAKARANEALSMFRSGGESQQVFDELLIVAPDGKVLLSTNVPWQDQNFSQSEVIRSLVNKQKTVPIFNPSPLYFNELVIFSTYPILNSQAQTIATIIGSNDSDIPINIIQTSASFLPLANGYYITDNNRLIGYNAGTHELMLMQPNTDYDLRVNNILNNNSGKLVQSKSRSNQDVFIYTYWFARLKMGLVIEIPTKIIYEQINVLSPFNLILLASSVLLSVIVIFTISSQLVSPLTQLTSIARKFTEGDWTGRAKVNRKDEIGLLAHSFNKMIEQLTDLYRTLENKVEERTQQIRLASDTAQLATSANSRDEIFQRITRALVQQFGYDCARIHLLDEAAEFAFLHNESIKDGDNIIDGLLDRDERVRIDANSLIGWTAKNNQARVLNSSEEIFPATLKEKNIASDVAIPVTINNQVMGILEVQSSKANAFDTETVSILQTLSSQIANGLQNIRLLESTKINLEETTLLYRASRQITQSKSAEEVLRVLSTTLDQTPYVNGIYTIERDHINVVSIHDPKNTGPRGSIHGIALPLLNIPETLKNSRQILVDDLSTSKQFENILSFFTRRGCHSAVIFPIIENQSVTKIIVIGSKEPGALSEAVLQPFANLMEVVTTTLERFGILDTLQDRVNELQVLSSISQAISGETNIQQLYRTLHQQITSTLGENLGFVIAIHNEKENKVEIPFLFEGNDIQPTVSFPIGEGLSSYVIQNQKPLLINKNTTQFAESIGVKVLGKPAKSWLGVPLIVAGNAIGALILQDLEKENRFDDQDLKLLTTLAPQIATSIRNAQLLMEMMEALTAYDQERFLLNSLLDNIPDQIYFKDTKSQYIRVSNSYAKTLGMQHSEQLVGMTDFELLGKEIGNEIFNEEQDLLLSGKNEIGEIKQGYDIYGNPTYHLISRIPLISSLNQTAGLLGISRDITELKTAQQNATRSANQLLTASEIARDTAGTLQLDEFLKRAVYLILERFGFYHASIFLLDPLNEFAILRESTGQAGEKLKSAGHKLALGSQSTVGQATATKKPLVINDVTQNPNYYANPLLPDTRAELAIPLMIGERVIGALDVQSTQFNAFKDQDIDVLQILADQLAVAITNANLFAHSQEILTRQRLVYQITSAAAGQSDIDKALLMVAQGLQTTISGSKVNIFLWNNNTKKLESHALAGYEMQKPEKMSFNLGEGIIGSCAREERPILISDINLDPRYIELDVESRSELAVPILYSGKLMGVINLESNEVAAFDDNDQELMATLGTSLGAIINNAELVQEIRNQVERERFINEATSRIRRSVDIQSILKSSADEICKALGANRAQIEVSIKTLAETESIIPANFKNNGNHHSKSGEAE